MLRQQFQSTRRFYRALPMLLAVVSFFQFIFVTASSSNGSSASAHERLQSLRPILQDLSSNSKHPELWRRLGKLQLDAGEFAEARRIFCRGSECCPTDDGLKHHVQVFEAFHEEEAHQENLVDKIEKDVPPALELPQKMEFLSLDVSSPNDIPSSILKHPFGLKPPTARMRLIHASQHPVLPLDACQHLIRSAETTTARIGWTKDRHLQAPTCDVPVFLLDRATKLWVKESFHNVLFPLLCQLVAPELDIHPQDLRVQDCFVVRYDGPSSSTPADGDAPGFDSLRPHQDESLLSLTIALNNMEVDYEDGGLFIASTQDVLNGPAGTVLCFAGGLVHGGYPVTKGTRWILTVFLYVDKNQSKMEPGYTLNALSEMKRNLGEGG